ncbi:MAG: TRAP transporter large permease, partial [Bacteroidales bacterium]
IFLMIVSYVMARKNGWLGNDRKATRDELLKVLKRSFWALLSPVIILGSIYAGICSPTEAAVTGVVYSYVIGTFVYRELKWEHVAGSMIDAALISGSTLFMVGITTALGRVLTVKAIPNQVCAALTSISDNPVVIFFLITVFLLIVGCFMDNISATIILAPILLPTITQFGMGAVQFGIVMTMLLAIGFITPPYGINLFVSSQLSGEPLMRIAKRAVPLMLAMLVASLLTMAFPPISMWLVNL